MNAMSHVLNYDGHYFRVEIDEIANVQLPDREYVEYVAWYSDAFKELQELPKQALSRFVAGPLPTYAEALRHAQDWIQSNWDSRRIKPMEDQLVSYTRFGFSKWMVVPQGMLLVNLRMRSRSPKQLKKVSKSPRSESPIPKAPNTWLFGRGQASRHFRAFG